MRTFFVMLSVGGVSLTDLQHPTNTHSDAVAIMFPFAGTGRARGSKVTTKSNSWAITAVAPPEAAARRALSSFLASWVEDITETESTVTDLSVPITIAHQAHFAIAVLIINYVNCCLFEVQSCMPCVLLLPLSTSHCCQLGFPVIWPSHRAGKSPVVGQSQSPLSRTFNPKGI